MYSPTNNDTIVAIATPPGVGAIAVIRVSGEQAIDIVNTLFPKKDLSKQKSHTLHFGILKDDNTLLDEVLLSLFKAPHSYTGEDIVEISCHGSTFIQQQILTAIQKNGARLAQPGEFTQRAFLNGKLDLTQAEAVADLIAAQSQAAQQSALNHLRGGFKNDLQVLREQLIHFAALIELELDFAEEDVEFADRTVLQNLILQLKNKTNTLIDSFRLGNVIKNGITVAIVGKPNAGKSTLLNALLNEERAIVSPIAGTTRDTIEETININGIIFRLIDTAGIRKETSDEIEKIGVEKSLNKMKTADIVLYLYDVNDTNASTDIEEQIKQLEGIQYLIVGNKVDLAKDNFIETENRIFISAKTKHQIHQLKQQLYHIAVNENINTENTIITNERHFHALQHVATALQAIESGIEQQISNDFLALEIRSCLHYLGEITGQIDVDRDILGTIFSKFCIGK